MAELSEFSKKVIAVIRKIPRGKVATYRQIAALAGKPQAARAVVWILHSCSKTQQLPWQRVLNAKGEIAFPRGSASWKKQKQLLHKEKIFLSAEGRVDMAKYQWKKKPRPRRTAGSAARPQMFRR
jgi:methylated-DNA-protein-cysteine methyltransferase-like protein